MLVKDIKKIIDVSCSYVISYEDDLKWFFKLLYDEVMRQVDPNDTELIEDFDETFSQDPIMSYNEFIFDLEELLNRYEKRAQEIFYKYKIEIKDKKIWFDDFEVESISSNPNKDNCICIWIKPIII